jgi:hypothetical protein
MVSTLAKGMAAGLAGAAVMTGAEKVEQALTRRPNSYVPARTLAHLLGLARPDEDRLRRNWLMHYGTGATVGALRGLMARANVRGPAASFMHTWMRLATDQTLENVTGVGAPPVTWPRAELAIDVAHKAIYSFATGVFADALIEPLPTSSVKRPAQRLRLPGFA